MPILFQSWNIRHLLGILFCLFCDITKQAEQERCLIAPISSIAPLKKIGDDAPIKTIFLVNELMKELNLQNDKYWLFVFWNGCIVQSRLHWVVWVNLFRWLGFGGPVIPWPLLAKDENIFERVLSEISLRLIPCVWFWIKSFRLWRSHQDYLRQTISEQLIQPALRCQTNTRSLEESDVHPPTRSGTHRQTDTYTHSAEAGGVCCVTAGQAVTNTHQTVATAKAASLERMWTVLQDSWH